MAYYDSIVGGLVSQINVGNYSWMGGEGQRTFIQRLPFFNRSSNAENFVNDLKGVLDNILVDFSNFQGCSFFREEDLGKIISLKASLMNIDIMLGHFTSYETSNVKKLLFLVLTELDEFLWAFKHTDLEKVAEYKSRIVNNLARKDGLIEFFRVLMDKI